MEGVAFLIGVVVGGGCTLLGVYLGMVRRG